MMMSILGALLVVGLVTSVVRWLFRGLFGWAYRPRPWFGGWFGRPMMWGGYRPAPRPMGPMGGYRAGGPGMGGGPHPAGMGRARGGMGGPGGGPRC